MSEENFDFLYIFRTCREAFTLFFNRLWAHTKLAPLPYFTNVRNGKPSRFLGGGGGVEAEKIEQKMVLGATT